jgi:hypothetical protein
VAIESVSAAISQIAQTTLRAVVGRHTLDETLSETDEINNNIREILDVQTEEWGVKVTVVELKDIQLPDSMQRAMARQAEAEREKRAKIIAAQGEALAAGELGRASDEMMAHPLALQLRNLQTMVEIGVDKNSTIMFPAPLMSTIEEIGAFLRREGTAAVSKPLVTSDIPMPAVGPPDQTRDTPHDDAAPVGSSTTPTNGVSGSGTRA